MSKSKVGKCRKTGDPGAYQPWFRKRKRRNRIRDRIAALSRWINRGK